MGSWQKWSMKIVIQLNICTRFLSILIHHLILPTRYSSTCKIKPIFSPFLSFMSLKCWDISKQIQIELHIDNLFQFHIIGFGVKKSSRWLHYNSKYMNLWCMYHYFIHITFLLYHIAKTDIIPKVYIKHQIWCHISIMDKFFSIYFLPITHNKSSTIGSNSTLEK